MKKKELLKRLERLENKIELLESEVAELKKTRVAESIPYKETAGSLDVTPFWKFGPTSYSTWNVHSPL